MNLKDWFLMQILDPGTRVRVPALPLDSTIKDWELNLSTNQDIKISKIAENGPLLLVFIRGTWCPFCQIHMKNLAIWASKLHEKRGTVIIVSSETKQHLQSWLDIHPTPFPFASDSNNSLADYFGVRILPNTFSQAATFLIDSDLTIRMVYQGKRTNKNLEAIVSAVSHSQKR